MNEMTRFDGAVLAGVVLLLVLWLVRFVRRSLSARCGCESNDNCSGCNGSSVCGQTAEDREVLSRTE